MRALPHLRERLVRLAQVEAQQRELVRLALEPRPEEGDRVARALLVACELLGLLAVDGIYAALHGHADCVRTLLDRGADHRKEDDETGWTALIAAVAFNERSVVEVLLEAGANPMRTMRTDNENNKGKHAIDIAELYNRKGEGSIKDLLYDYKEKRRLERIAKGDYQRKGIPPDRKGKYEL